MPHGFCIDGPRKGELIKRPDFLPWVVVVVKEYGAFVGNHWQIYKPPDCDEYCYYCYRHVLGYFFSINKEYLCEPYLTILLFGNQEEINEAC